jgi:hypothetical protein
MPPEFPPNDFPDRGLPHPELAGKDRLGDALAGQPPDFQHIGSGQFGTPVPFTTG